MIGLVWNGMMSFGGGWFFLAASEAISVGNQQLHAARASAPTSRPPVDEGDLEQGAARHRRDDRHGRSASTSCSGGRWSPGPRSSASRTSEAAEAPRSFVLDLLRRSRDPAPDRAPLRPVDRELDRITPAVRAGRAPAARRRRRSRRAGDVAVRGRREPLVGVRGVPRRGRTSSRTASGSAQFGHCVRARAASPSPGSSCSWSSRRSIWVPVGVKIGMNPRAGPLRAAGRAGAAPASRPTSCSRSLTALFIATGHQPEHRRHRADGARARSGTSCSTSSPGPARSPPTCAKRWTNFGVPRLQRWRELILPAIFPSYVTGGITAAGGAWNASIVAEIVTYGEHHAHRDRPRRLHHAGDDQRRLRRGPHRASSS